MTADSIAGLTALTSMTLSRMLDIATDRRTKGGDTVVMPGKTRKKQH